MSAPSPFHRGERLLQARVGLGDRMDAVGRVLITGQMPEQHREFYARLPMLLVGSEAPSGKPEIALLTGSPGFVHAPDPELLRVAELGTHRKVGASVAVLGIEPHTRRRNRVNGVVREVDAFGFTLQVRQSFGNCPKYIQARQPRLLECGARPAAGAVTTSRRLDDRTAQWIQSTDTFFIASTYRRGGEDGDGAHGADVSHRGGHEGFVRVDRQGPADVLWVPDFSGNFAFNTLGNLLLLPDAALLFLDYERGDVMHVDACAEIIEEGAELASFAGAQRLLRLTVARVRVRPAAAPLRWTAPEPSPHLRATGQW